MTFVFSYSLTPSRIGRTASALLIPILAGALWLSASTSAFASTVTEVPENVTFAEHVAPIFMTHCVSCHRPDDAAPMSLLSYEEARPWAKSIRKVVAGREMPPWDADRRYGDFSNDISLDDNQIEVIRRWVDQGAESGNLANMPAVPALPPAGSWKMGRQPDAVIDLAEVVVPAGGPDLFVTQFAVLDVPEGKWLQALEILPGNTDVLHHVVTYLGHFGMSEEDAARESSNAGINSVVYLNEKARKAPPMTEAPAIGGVWVAGSPPNEFRTGTGHTLKSEQRISFNMHYHPSGNAGNDSSKLGLYFGEGAMEKEITTAFAADPGMYIPAGAADHHEKALYRFAQDSQILSLLPHMHNRGKAMKYTLEYPDGRKEVLLDVPEYDYNWQNIYQLAEPKKVPAGSVVAVEAVWDNSADNPANPDATLDVPWGDGTNNEMLVAFIDFIVEDGLKPKPIRTNGYIDALLDRHESDEAYAISVEGMSFGGNWGLVLPKDSSQEGTFYMYFDRLMFSTSIRDVQQVGDQLVFNGAMISSGGGTRTPLGFIAKRSEGSIEGELFFGREIDADKLVEWQGTGRSFTGKSRAAVAAGSSATGSGGR